MELRRRIDLELWIVFGLSLGKSAIYSILALAAALTAERGLAGTSTTINRSEAAQQWLDFSWFLWRSSSSSSAPERCLESAFSTKN
jgi:hypothetical protein